MIRSFFVFAGTCLALTTALSLDRLKHATASPMSPTKDISCNNLRLKGRPDHRNFYSSYKITNKHLIVKNGIGGGKYPTDGTEISLPHSTKARIRSDYQDIVIFATPNIIGTGPFVISRHSCPEFLSDGIELFMPPKSPY